MGNFVFNIAKGRVNELARLNGTDDALVAVVLETTGLEGDGTLDDYDTLAALLAGASNEQATMGRQELTGVVVSTDDGNSRQGFTADDIVWDPADGNAFSKLVICYDPDTTTGDDTDLIPLVGLDFTGDPAGPAVTAHVNAAGMYRAS